jgi:hypothetical protein
MHLAHLVFEQQVRQFVCQVTEGAARVVAWVVHGDAPSVGQMESGGGKRARLQPFESEQVLAWHELICRQNLDTEVAGDLLRVERLVVPPAELLTQPCAYAFGLGFETATHYSGPTGVELVLHPCKEVGESRRRLWHESARGAEVDAT